MNDLHADFETFCHLDVKAVGAQVYARHLSCEVLMMSWAIGNGPVQLWVPEGPWDYESIPERVLRHIAKGGPVFAHNVEFEWNIFKHVLGIEISLGQLRDTAVLALRRGYPMSLAGASTAVGIEQKKDTRGGALIRRFCQPRKPSKNNPTTRWTYDNSPDEWVEFCEYCIQDTIVERELAHRLSE